jgi:hypothetical protein
MQVEVLVVPDCPNAETTATVVRRALDEFGLSAVPITTVLVTSQEQAEQAGFVGSPTIMIDGRDPFADTSQKPALTCRLYRDGATLTGTPPAEHVRRAIQSAIGP